MGTRGVRRAHCSLAWACFGFAQISAEKGRRDFLGAWLPSLFAAFVRKDCDDELHACNEEVLIEENGPLHPCGTKARSAGAILAARRRKRTGRFLREGDWACMKSLKSTN